jgi:predicted DNA repair protein MutK
MPSSSFFALLDDIATLLDDVAVMTKVAAKKTAGVLGDDLALNAQGVTGVDADRELPVIWAVAKGSLVNKLILVPAALLVSAAAPRAVLLLLMLGGLYLCFEGFEKIAHKLLHPPAEDEAHHQALLHAVSDAQVDVLAFERDKIKGAVRTDFILSAEIIVIALGTVATAPLGTRVAALSLISLVMTVGVYGLVAGIVKLDDLGLYLSRQSGVKQSLGGLILLAAPALMKLLSLLGTIAMFLVGGSILGHGIPPLHHAQQAAEHATARLPTRGPLLAPRTQLLLDGLIGLLAGALAVLLHTAGQKILQRLRGR